MSILPIADRRHSPKLRAYPRKTDSSPGDLTTTSASVTAAHSHSALELDTRPRKPRTMLALYNHARLGQAPPQLGGTISLSPRSASKGPRKDHLHFRLERKERCTSPKTLDPLRQAEPEVKAELTRPQDTTKNCLSYIRKAKDR